MLDLFRELLLSWVILILVVYGLKGRLLKVSILMLIIVGMISLWLRAELVYTVDYGINGLLLTSDWVDISKGLLVIVCVSLLLMYSYKSQEKEGGDSWIMLVLIVLLGSLLLVSSVNWVSIYLALELQTLTLFILVAIRKNSAYSTEAGLKYFVLGAVSSGLFLFGCGLLYGVSGEMSIQGINSVLIGDVGKILITVSLLFKLSAVPFHMWAPDVYEGAPTITVALLAVMPKIGVFSVLVQAGLVSNVVLFCGVLSIIYGAIGALNQTKMKRLLAYSGIGHMGFIIFGVAIGSFESIQASLMYIIIYVIMSICGFSVLLFLKLTRALIIEVGSLSRENPVMALTLGLTFLSTAGIPPLAGFLGKWLILLSGVSSGYYLTCMVIVMASVIAGVYYVRVVQIIYFPNYFLLTWQKVINRLEVINLRKSILLGVAFFIILFIMVSPNWVLQVTHDATISLYL
uniref:NADH:ubiquinone reductase (H(+)-translocating) n=1 Tax=Iotrochota birotulata TaxID=283497 RepID=I6LIJ7_IOTBI|nr:NADH dehydrogenase subunit 2 [Iotrochota birotulata]ABW83878.1 NADH dehydrogenase subunit 2 [Iotrochota birotulata]